MGYKQIGHREALRASFIQDYPAEWKQPDEVSPVFLLGTGKCATTTTQNLLNLSEDVAAYHEVPPRLWHLGQKVWDSPPELDPMWATVLWAAKRDIISVVHSAGLTYAECNHRLTNWAHIIKDAIPQSRFLLVWRDFEETVVSGSRWGWYRDVDRNREGRVGPPEGEVTDAREAVAWYWCQLHSYVLKQLESMDRRRFYVLPFSAIRDKNIDKIQEVFRWMGVSHTPAGAEIERVLGEKINASDTRLEVPKNWERFDQTAAAITRRLEDVGD